MEEWEIKLHFGNIVKECYTMIDETRNEIRTRKIKIKFKNGSKLDVFEKLKDLEGVYSYHWRSITNTLIIRWDMGIQHPEISTSPFHQHIATDDNILPSEPMNLEKVLKYIMSILGVSLLILTTITIYLRLTY